MGLSMAQRKAVTKQMAKRYAKATKKDKGSMLDELCELTGWTRRHARRALVEPATKPRSTPRQTRRASSARLRSVMSIEVPTNSTRSSAALKTGWPNAWTYLIVPSG